MLKYTQLNKDLMTEIFVRIITMIDCSLLVIKLKLLTRRQCNLKKTKAPNLSQWWSCINT